MAYTDHLTVNEYADLMRLLKKGGNKVQLTQFSNQVAIIAGSLDNSEMAKLANLASRVGVRVGLMKPSNPMAQIRQQEPAPKPVTECRDRSQSYGKDGNRGLVSNFSGLSEAKEIMGQNFLGPDEAISLVGRSRVFATKSNLAMPFSTDTLKKFSKDGILVWMPNMTVQEICECQPGHLVRDFMSGMSLKKWDDKDTLISGWRLLRKFTVGSVPYMSFDRLWMTKNSVFPSYYGVASLNLVLYAAVGLESINQETIFHDGWAFCRNLNPRLPEIRIACRYVPELSGYDMRTFERSVNIINHSVGLAVEITPHK